MQFQYEESGDGFMASLAYTNQKTTQETTQETTVGVVQREILKLLLKNPNYTRHELAGVLRKSDATIKEHISKLKKLGLLERVGSTKSGSWRVKEKKK